MKIRRTQFTRESGPEEHGPDFISPEIFLNSQDTAQPRPARPLFAVFFLCFLISGAAGLFYEVLWMRQFGLVMGNTSISLSAVLTAFMGGLAIGSWIGGRIAD
ncbi:hypothetical protein HYR69_08995, partial [Candidatus Sumerlaeota bacterium]|nr:hypothetical protein [Candidatus Sumerlaeota bacterium]